MEISDNGNVLDIAYDFYGKMKAVSSTTKNIYIYSKDEEKNEWFCKHKISTNDLPLRLDFASPVYSNLLATCGLDKKVVIYKEEKETDEKQTWKIRSEIPDLKNSVNDISFCPDENGLKIALVTQDGKLKIYESTDNQTYFKWSIKSSLDVDDNGCSSLSWNPSYDEPLTIAVGCKGEGNKEFIKIYCYDEKQKNFILISGIKGEKLTLSVTDVEFSEQLGRDYMLLASSSIDKNVNIWKIKLDYKIEGGGFADIKMKYQNIFNYSYDKPLWRVSWNSLGIYLAVSSEDRIPLVFRKCAGDKFAKFDINKIEEEKK